MVREKTEQKRPLEIDKKQLERIVKEAGLPNLNNQEVVFLDSIGYHLLNYSNNSVTEIREAIANLAKIAKICSPFSVEILKRIDTAYGKAIRVGLKNLLPPLISPDIFQRLSPLERLKRINSYADTYILKNRHTPKDFPEELRRSTKPSRVGEEMGSWGESAYKAYENNR